MAPAGSRTTPGFPARNLPNLQVLSPGLFWKWAFLPAISFMIPSIPKDFQWIPCENCGSDSFDRVVSRDPSAVVRCKSCGLEFINPLPEEDYLASLYQSEMQGKNDTGPYFKEYIEDRSRNARSYEKIYFKRMELIEGFVPAKGALLDLGCGAGFFLDFAKKRGWEAHGLDILPEYIDLARNQLGLDNVHCSRLEEMDFPENRFRVVTLWDLIEHLRHPLDYLRRINRIMEADGKLVIWTPNTRNAAYLRDRWTGYGPRQHLYFFSRDTLGPLLQKAGFQPAYWQTTKTKKGMFIPQDSLTFQKIVKPASRWGRIVFSMKRDLNNFINPMTYLSPVMDELGFGFNLLVVAVKSRPLSPDACNS